MVAARSRLAASPARPPCPASHALRHPPGPCTCRQYQQNKSKTSQQGCPQERCYTCANLAAETGQRKRQPPPLFSSHGPINPPQPSTDPPQSTAPVPKHAQPCSAPGALGRCCCFISHYRSKRCFHCRARRFCCLGCGWLGAGCCCGPARPATRHRRRCCWAGGGRRGPSCACPASHNRWHRRGPVLLLLLLLCLLGLLCRRLHLPQHLPPAATAAGPWLLLLHLVCCACCAC